MPAKLSKKITKICNNKINADRLFHPEIKKAAKRKTGNILQIETRTL